MQTHIHCNVNVVEFTKVIEKLVLKGIHLLASHLCFVCLHITLITILHIIHTHTYNLQYSSRRASPSACTHLYSVLQSSQGLTNELKLRCVKTVHLGQVAQLDSSWDFKTQVRDWCEYFEQINKREIWVQVHLSALFTSYNIQT